MLRDINYNFYTHDRTSPWNGDRVKDFKSMIFLRIFVALWKVSDYRTGDPTYEYGNYTGINLLWHEVQIKMLTIMSLIQNCDFRFNPPP